MRLGVIARPESRGLGLQSWEVTQHLDCSVLLVDVGDDNYDRHWDRYPDATRVQWRHSAFTDRNLVRRWLENVDVVYTAETFYDPAFTSWTQRAGVATVCQLNPEFWLPGPEPTAWWSATGWRLDLLPRNTEVVPFPVAAERFVSTEPHEGPTRWLHAAGYGAMWDRNGTDAVLQALPLLREPCSVTIASQRPGAVSLPAVPPHVNVEVRGPVADYWTLYEGHDAYVFPRRYGGLCLSAQEALAGGLAVAMTACSPNPESWPIAAIRSHEGPLQRMYAGKVNVAEVDPADVAVTMDRLAEPKVRQSFQATARHWAAANSWGVQADVWRARFEELVGG